MIDNINKYFIYNLTTGINDYTFYSINKTVKTIFKSFFVAQILYDKQ